MIIERRREEAPRRKPTRVLTGELEDGAEAYLYEPTAGNGRWRIRWTNEDGSKGNVTGTSREGVLQSAREKLGLVKPVPKLPTFNEAFETWVRSGKHSAWVSGTTNSNRAAAKRIMAAIGGKRIDEVQLEDIRRIDLRQADGTPLSDNQQKRVRSLVRRVFDYCHDTYGTPGGRIYADEVQVTSNWDRGVASVKSISKDMVPHEEWVASLITLTASTMNVTPLDERLDAKRSTPDARCVTGVDPVTGDKTRTQPWEEPLHGAASITPIDDDVVRGLPRDMRGKPRGVPHLTVDVDGYLARQNEELAARYRLWAAWFAMGAGAGTRIGEQSALRVRHLLDPKQVAFLFQTAHIQHWDEETDRLLREDNNLPVTERRGWYGTIDVVEQYTQSGSRNILTRPKMNNETDDKSRVIHMPYYLPSWRTANPNGDQRDQIAAHIPRFARNDTDPTRNASFWTSTREEVGILWEAGYTPIGWLVLQRLIDAWNDPNLDRVSHGVPSLKLRHYRDMLLYPTRFPARRDTVDKFKARMPATWKTGIDIIPGTGWYMSHSNIEQDTNPIMDYTSALLATKIGEERAYPPYQRYAHSHRRKDGTPPRRGWTHHSLRHYMATSRINHGGNLTLIAKELGHRSIDVTIRTYIHIINDKETTPATGYEY
ncbi:tyrosine-type recombinase/integrase [Bifidobacterium tissieri]|nr:tyrosine-type recombinase/integrase [Bifidobacterium tissieri]